MRTVAPEELTGRTVLTVVSPSAHTLRLRSSPPRSQWTPLSFPDQPVDRGTRAESLNPLDQVRVIAHGGNELKGALHRHPKKAVTATVLGVPV